VNFSGTKNKGYFIFNFTLKYLSFSMLLVRWLTEEQVLNTGFISGLSTCCPLVTKWAARRNWPF
jgi:hypothetical protein